jgi:hypothetical protein
MSIVTLILATALTIDFRGVGLITPWKSADDGARRVWVFLPATGTDMPRHHPKLLLPKESVVSEDWKARDGAGGWFQPGVWNLDGYVLSIYREGTREAPEALRTPAPAYERTPWQSLHWMLNLDRIAAPDGRIKDDLLSSDVSAAIKLSEGVVEAVAPKRKERADIIWTVTPAENYQQAFTDTVRYRLDLPDTATELRLDPLPGKQLRAKRIRLLKGRDVNAMVTHEPDSKPRSFTSHAPVLANLFADKQSADRIKAITVMSTDWMKMGGDPLCDFPIFHMLPQPRPGPPCGPEAYCPAAAGKN